MVRMKIWLACVLVIFTLSCDRTKYEKLSNDDSVGEKNTNTHTIFSNSPLPTSEKDQLQEAELSALIANSQLSTSSPQRWYRFITNGNVFMPMDFPHILRVYRIRGNFIEISYSRDSIVWESGLYYITKNFDRAAKKSFYKFCAFTPKNSVRNDSNCIPVSIEKLN